MSDWPAPPIRGGTGLLDGTRRALVLLGTAALCACAAPSRVDVAAEAVAPADVPFDVSGRLSARHGENAVAASFRWLHAPDADELLLSTPFGQALARLTGSAGGVVLELADGAVARAGDWETLTRDALGVPVPVRGLAWWVRAAPPGDVQEQVDLGRRGHDQRPRGVHRVAPLSFPGASSASRISMPG